jgi:hypothetical protein
MKGGVEMIRRVGLAMVLTAVAGFALPGPSGALGATTLGQTFVPTDSTTCNGGPDWEVVQTGRASGTSYAAPSAGVLTSWSFEAGSFQTVLTLRVFHPTGTAHEYQVIADGGPLQTIAASSGLHTFPIQIPVAAGDLIGIRSTSGGCASPTGNGADIYDLNFGTATPVGMSDTYSPNSGFIWDIAAQLEPDCDGDALGDETQDADVSACHSNAFTFAGVTLNKKKGTATLNVNVPEPGQLIGSGNGAKVAASGATISKTVTPGTAQLLIKAKGKKKRALNETGKVKLRVAVTYTPTRGKSNTQSIKVKLKKKL